MQFDILLILTKPEMLPDDWQFLLKHAGEFPDYRLSSGHWATYSIQICNMHCCVVSLLLTTCSTLKLSGTFALHWNGLKAPRNSQVIPLCMLIALGQAWDYESEIPGYPGYSVRVVTTRCFERFFEVQETIYRLIRVPCSLLLPPAQVCKFWQHCSLYLDFYLPSQCKTWNIGRPALASSECWFFDLTALCLTLQQVWNGLFSSLFIGHALRKWIPQMSYEACWVLGIACLGRDHHDHSDWFSHLWPVDWLF